MKILAIILFALLAACARPDYLTAEDLTPQEATYELSQQHLRFSIEWTQGPQSPDMSEFILRFWPEGATPAAAVDPEGELSVILWMPSMGHGSAPVKIEKISQGVYRVTNVYFIMPGDWEVQVYIKDGTQILDQKFVSLML